MKLAAAVLVVAWLIAPASASCADDPLAGDYVARAGATGYELSLRSDDGRVYDGYLRVDGVTRALEARRFGDRILGQADNSIDSVAIVVEPRGMGVLLRLDGAPPVFLRRR